MIIDESRKQIFEEFDKLLENKPSILIHYFWTRQKCLSGTRGALRRKSQVSPASDSTNFSRGFVRDFVLRLSDINIICGLEK